MERDQLSSVSRPVQYWAIADFSSLLVHTTTEPSDWPMLEEWGKNASVRFQDTNGFGHPATYVSYAHGDESQEALYGKRKLERLRALKKKWDPKDIFSFNAGIKV